MKTRKTYENLPSDAPASEASSHIFGLQLSFAVALAGEQLVVAVAVAVAGATRQRSPVKMELAAPCPPGDTFAVDQVAHVFH